MKSPSRPTSKSPASQPLYRRTLASIATYGPLWESAADDGLVMGSPDCQNNPPPLCVFARVRAITRYGFDVGKRPGVESPENMKPNQSARSHSSLFGGQLSRDVERASV